MDIKKIVEEWVDDRPSIWEGADKNFEFNCRTELIKALCTLIGKIQADSVIERAGVAHNEYSTESPLRQVETLVRQLPSEKDILYCAMAIVNHTNKWAGTDVEKRQQTNDDNFDFGVEKIKELIARQSA